MFRKHGHSKFNQHIRLIQRLVPRRQHFSHNPIHPSRSIPHPGPHFPGCFAHLCQLKSVFLAHAILVLHCGFTTTARLSLSTAPLLFLLSIFFSFSGAIWSAQYAFFISFSISTNIILQYIPGQVRVLPRIRKSI